MEGLATYLSSKGITSFGCRVSGTQRYYCPDVDIKRFELAIFIHRSLKGNETLSSCSNTFSDETGQFCSFAEFVYKNNIMSSCGTQNGKPKFCSNETVSRAEMARIAVNILLYKNSL